MKMNRAWIRVTPQNLVEKLGLPKGTQIARIELRRDVPWPEFLLGIINPNLPAVDETEHPLYTPVFKDVLDKGPSYKMEFVEWGTPVYPNHKERSEIHQSNGTSSQGSRVTPDS